MDNTKMMPLEQEFHEECIRGSRALQKNHGYNPTYFLRMIYEYGGVEGTKRLLQTENFQDGLTKLMSVEAAVLDPRWSGLFSEEEKRKAKQRLDRMNYKPPS